MSTFGEELRRERELREITLREVAEATKINLRYLEALELNDFEHLPGGVFNKGFVRAYCQFIGVDPETMVNAYLHEQQAQDQGPGRGSELLRGTAGTAAARPAGAAPRRGRRWVWALVLILTTGLIVALVVSFLRLRPAGAESGAPRADTARGGQR